MLTPKKQLADMLTEGNFTHDEWNHLLRLFNISHFSLIYCSQKFSLASCTEAMAKRIQEQKGEEKIVAKSKPTLNLASLVSANSSTVQSPITSKSPEILKAPCQNDWTSTGRLGAREFNQDAASSSQAWQKDSKMYEETRRFRKRRHQRQRQHLATQSPYINRLRTAHGEGFLDCETKIWSQSERQN